MFRRQKKREQDLDRELRSDLELEAAEQQENGLSAEEARYAAQKALGNKTLMKEEIRKMWRWNSLDLFIQDLRYGVRQLRRSLGFTVAILVTIGLGIGANTAIFSILHATLLRSLPYRDPARLVAISQRNLERQQNDTVTGGDYTDWKTRNHVFSDLAYSWDTPYTLTGSGPAQSLTGYQLSTNLFSMLGARALLGRTFLPDEGEPGKDHVAVLSYRLWQGTFDGDPNVVGREIRLDGNNYTVIGVMPRDFAHPGTNVKLWTPLLLPSDLAQNRKLHALHVVGRLKPGITISEAQSQMEALARQSAREYPETNRHYGVQIESIRDSYVENIKSSLWILQVAVFFLFLIACANVANMLLARASTAEREMAIRLALGAGKGRLFSQSLTQAMILSVGGAALGLLLAIYGVQILAKLFESQLSTLLLPNHTRDWISWPVLLFMIGTAIVAALVFGAIPAFRGTRPSQEMLRASGRGLTERSFVVRLRSLLIVSQVALSLVLLVGSALLVRSFLHLQERSFGFQTDHVLSFVIILPSNQYPRVSQTSSFLQQTLTHIDAIPGVVSAAAINTLPLSGMDARRPFTTPEEQPDSIGQQRIVQFRVITPQYFKTMRIPLRRGRFFNERDRMGSREVAIVSETLALRLWPNSDPIGRTINVADLGTVEPREVVGVVGDVRHSGLASEPPIEVYRPAYQTYWPFFAIAVRSSLSPSQVIAPVRQAVSAVDKGLPVNDVRTMDELAADSTALRRASMLLLGVFTGLAIFLAALGIYGVISYAVTLRTQEIGLRMALGARPLNILTATVGQSVKLTLIGVGIGLLVAVGVTKYLASFLVGMTARDPLTLLLATIGMLLISIAAAYFPARRASGVDPMRALKYE